ncbi:hypothetical protein J8N05_46825 (plasmid) [Streptomyces sp. BH-SS-21]|uniref:Uncharacterized protein n=1 Tax=Streptomyces liliiviolaceus TaxID=2823109 RepID=A0A940Y4W6_9ACTN|nr:hypothetical protein [Streptomyces liliiviolaceus]MBQ0855676.1 hypothetical protein [Streptomyces liliiviolaceus]
MTANVASGDDWISEITAQARRTQYRVFSTSVPLNNPPVPGRAAEHLFAAAIEHVKAQSWQLDSVNTYGSTYRAPQIGPVSEHWALLVFRTTHRAQICPARLPPSRATVPRLTASNALDHQEAP